MGWSFRKSKKFGPFRLNLSKSGVGMSVGVKGARVSVGPRGTRLNLEKYGVRYNTKLGGSTGGNRSYGSQAVLQEYSNSPSYSPTFLCVSVSQETGDCANCSQINGAAWLPGIVEPTIECTAPDHCSSRIATIDLAPVYLLSIVPVLQTRGGYLSREEFLELAAATDKGIGIERCPSCGRNAVFVQRHCSLCMYYFAPVTFPSQASIPPPPSIDPPSQRARIETKLGEVGTIISKKSGRIDLDFILDNQSGPRFRIYAYYTSGNARGHMILLSRARYSAFRQTIVDVSKQLSDWRAEGRINRMELSISESVLKFDYPIALPYEIGFISAFLTITEDKAAYFTMYFQQTDDKRKSGVLVHLDQQELDTLITATQRADELFQNTTAG
jgi:hypothetical protein